MQLQLPSSNEMTDQLDQSEDRCCSVALNKRWRIYFDLSFICLLVFSPLGHFPSPLKYEPLINASGFQIRLSLQLSAVKFSCSQAPMSVPVQIQIRTMTKWQMLLQTQQKVNPIKSQEHVMFSVIIVIRIHKKYGQLWVRRPQKTWEMSNSCGQ